MIHTNRRTVSKQKEGGAGVCVWEGGWGEGGLVCVCAWGGGGGGVYSRSPTEPVY